MSEIHPENQMTRLNQKQRNLEEDRPTQHEERDCKEKDMDRTHPPKINQQCHETGLRLESTRKKKNRQTQNSNTTWRRSIAEEVNKHGTTWKEMKKAANNRVHWKRDVSALCSTLSEED